MCSDEGPVATSWHLRGTGRFMGETGRYHLAKWPVTGGAILSAVELSSGDADARDVGLYRSPPHTPSVTALQTSPSCCFSLAGQVWRARLRGLVAGPCPPPDPGAPGAEASSTLATCPLSTGARGHSPGARPKEGNSKRYPVRP